MQSRDFVYWLQGFFEIADAGRTDTLTAGQVEIIRNHLNMVFVHEIDPSMGDKKHQDELQAVHDQRPDGGFMADQFNSRPPKMYRC